MTEAIASDERANTSARETYAVAPALGRWLLIVWALVWCMVLVGGITRLTGSGLSIVEWKPLMGAVPPLTQADWLEVWNKYQHSPQYRDVNHWMTLADFKRIFFWEYVHRLLGRAIGAVVLLPWLYFVVRRRMPRALAFQTLGLFVLGGLQGLLGWYMVASGLVDEPRVSHFRLAAHLLLAFATGQLTLWLALEVYFPRQRARALHGGRLWAVVAALLLFSVQVCYGAFMAGTHAGYYSATFPDMNGHYLPGTFFTGPSIVADALNNPTAIHYLHRLFGWLLLGFAIGLWVYLRSVRARNVVASAAAVVAILTFVQFNLGALTVLQYVRIPFAIAHQALAYLLVSSAVFLLHRALGSGRS